MNDSSSARVIAEQLRTEVAAMPTGARLPSQRELVGRFGASATTVAQALAHLAGSGLVHSRPGAGTFRAPSLSPVVGDFAWQDAALALTEGLQERPHLARQVTAAPLAQVLSLPTSDVVDFNGGYLHPALQPAQLLAASLTRVSRRPEAWDRPPAAGLGGLREWFAHDIGGGLSRHQVLVAPGGQSALATTLQALTGPGDAVVIEAPTYPGTIAAAHAASLRVVPVPLDEHGVIPEHVEEALARTGARVVVVQPLHQNPTGVSMTLQRQQALLRVAQAHGAFVIEDDFARDLTHAGSWTPPAPMISHDPDGHVIHLRSLTKSTSPNLRVAAIAARGPVLSRIQSVLTIATLLVPAVLQHTALEVVTAPGWRRARSNLQTELGRRCSAMTNVLASTLGYDAVRHRPRGGYHLWLSLPADCSGADLARSALAGGVAVTAGENYFPGGNDQRPNVRLSYVAAPGLSEVEEGARRFGAVVASRVAGGKPGI